jgi:hypothetical protein
MPALSTEQTQKGPKRLFRLERIEPVEFLALNCLRFPTGGNAQNVPRRTAGVEFDRFKQARLSGIVLSNEEVQTAQSWEFEVAEKLETGNVEGWNHG